MNNAHVYYGPDDGFAEYVDANATDPDKFSAFVNQLDEKRRTFFHKMEGAETEIPNDDDSRVESLVVTSDDYASVREHVILNFGVFLSSHVMGDIFLQNPPMKIAKEIKGLANKTIEVTYQYLNLTKEMLPQLNKAYAQEIVGQPDALRNLLIALYPLTRPNPTKPVVILFFGPSGVGKTETAKILSQRLGGDLFRKQMSMFQNVDFMTYLFGGKHSEGSFAKDLLERETNVILLDEFDKANSFFHSAFYQLFDEGAFVDKNYHVQLGSPVIICTSNYANESEIRDHLGDPMHSRFDAIIEFKALSEDAAKTIVQDRIEKEFDLLQPSEVEMLDRAKIEETFGRHYKKLNNARRIESLVRTIVSNSLLEILLNEKEESH